MASNPLVSAVVTTYDRPGRCKRALRSVRGQTYDRLEVVVVEDGSETDVDRWLAAEFPDATYVRHEENRGLAAARNTGLDWATGEYVAYLDDDDEWKPERVDRQVRRLLALDPDERADVGVVYCGVERRTPDGAIHSIGRPENEGNLAASIQQVGASTLSSTFLFDRDALAAVGGFDESLPSSIDHDVWMALATHDYSVLAVDEPLVLTYVSDRDRMVTDAASRIVGVRQFVEKWMPTYREWFGPTEGERYAQRYFARVVARLAAENAVGGNPRGAWRATTAIFAYSDQYRYNAVALSRTVAVVAIVRLAPPSILERLRGVKGLLTRERAIA